MTFLISGGEIFFFKDVKEIIFGTYINEMSSIAFPMLNPSHIHSALVSHSLHGRSGISPVNCRKEGRTEGRKQSMFSL